MLKPKQQVGGFRGAVNKLFAPQNAAFTGIAEGLLSQAGGIDAAVAQGLVSGQKALQLSHQDALREQQLRIAQVNANIKQQQLAQQQAQHQAVVQALAPQQQAQPQIAQPPLAAAGQPIAGRAVSEQQVPRGTGSALSLRQILQSADPRTRGLAQFQLQSGDIKGAISTLKPDRIAKALTSFGQAEAKGQAVKSLVQKGFIPNDFNDLSKGFRPIAGGPADVVKPQNVGRVQMLRTAQNAMGLAHNIFFNQDGTPNQTNILTAQTVPLLDTPGVPGTKGREGRALIEQGIQAALRLETGAAARPEEVKNIMNRFLPSPFDSDETKHVKWSMYQDFINGALKVMDPNGRFNEKRFRTIEGRRLRQAGIEHPAEGSTRTLANTTRADLKKMSPQQLNDLRARSAR